MDPLVVAGLVAFLVALGATRLAEVVGRRRRLLDVPNARSSHVVPTPRIGGLGLVAGVLAGWLVAGGWEDATGIVVVIAAIALAVVGLADDVGRSSVAGKYLAQLVTSAAAAIAIAPELVLQFGGGGITIGGPAAVVVVTIWLTAIINAFTFIDGIDGMLGSVAVVIAVGGMALAGDGALALLVAAGACLGFLVWNWAPASIFMGDVGSQFLGLLIGASLLRQRSDEIDAVAVVILCGVLLADTGYTLVRRAVAGRNLFAAHREHLYQRLVASGRFHREVAALYAAATAATAVAAMAWTAQGPVIQAAIIVAMGAAFAGLVRWVARAERSGAGREERQPDA